MKTETAHKLIDSYLSYLKTDSDKLTQFYQACKIAKQALTEYDILREKHSKLADNYNDLLHDSY